MIDIIKHIKSLPNVLDAVPRYNPKIDEYFLELILKDRVIYITGSADLNELIRLIKETPNGPT